MAVGTYVKPSGAGVNLAERWNGSSWRILPTPNPAGIAVSSLLGVACTAPSACTAVGASITATGVSRAVAERWNGTRWRLQATPTPPRGGGFLNAVSCTSASSCTAVGKSGAGTLAERWNGTRWTIQATPNPPQGGAGLSGVSCTSASACTAVGGSTAGTLAERWNGTRWRIQATPSPQQGGGFLTSVACTSALACTAVGLSNAGTLAERWNGAGWSIQPTPTPAGVQFVFLNNVACTSPSACTAVGAYLNSSGAFQTLAERWDGTAWHRQATPSPAGTSLLIGVACTAQSACTAVGYSNADQTPAVVAERWNGSAWNVRAAPNPPGAASSHFNSVACTSPSACTAVGVSTSRTRTVVSLAEQWNGRFWRIQVTPNPPGGGALNGTACSSASACTAVGNTATGQTLAERWNGTRWRIQTTPNPAGAAGAALFGVACTSNSSCMAAGTAFNSSGSPVRLFSERWDGAAWHLQAAPMPTGSPGSFFAALACTSPSFCTAVGARTDSAGNPVGTLAERWNGTRWSIQPTPNPAPGGVLAAVSCTAMAACTAAGNLNGTSTSGTTTLAERWNGAKWTIQATPKLSAGQGSFFNAVACKAGVCTAVGLYLPASGPLTLAERWNGTSWHIQPTPNPGGAYDIDPPAVACPRLSVCTAVAGYTNNGPKVTLAEQWNGNGQTALLSKSRSVALGNSPSACLRALLLGLPQGWQRTPASPQRWSRAETLFTPASKARRTRPHWCPAA